MVPGGADELIQPLLNQEVNLFGVMNQDHHQYIPQEGGNFIVVPNNNDLDDSDLDDMNDDLAIGGGGLNVAINNNN